MSCFPLIMSLVYNEYLNYSIILDHLVSHIRMDQFLTYLIIFHKGSLNFIFLKIILQIMISNEFYDCYVIV